MSLFDAWRHGSTTSLKDLKLRFERQFSRMDRRTFSCGFGSGRFVGEGISAKLGGPVSRPVEGRGQPVAESRGAAVFAGGDDAPMAVRFRRPMSAGRSGRAGSL